MKSFKNIFNIQNVLNPKNKIKTNNFILKNLINRTKINQENNNFIKIPLKRSNSFSSTDLKINEKKINYHINNNYISLTNKSKQNLNKKTLILDLDETLIHSYVTDDIIINNNNNLLFQYYSNEDNSQKYIRVIFRPYLKEFLETISKKFEIVIFTASIKNYASPLIDIIDRNNICKHRLFRDDCLMINGTFIKNLELLNKNLKDVIIIDNSSKSFLLHPQNGIKIKSFINDLNDKELLYLIPILNFLSNVYDVRKYINYIKELNIESFKNYEFIINYFKKENKFVLKKRNENYQIYKKFLSDDNNFFIKEYNFMKEENQKRNKIKIKNINLLNLKKLNKSENIKKNSINSILFNFKLNKSINNNNDYFSNKILKKNFSFDKNKKLHNNYSFNCNLNSIKINKFKFEQHINNIKLMKNYSYNEEILNKNKIKLNKSKLKLKSEYKKQNKIKIFIKPLKFKNKKVNNLYKLQQNKSNKQINCNYKI